VSPAVLQVVKTFRQAAVDEGLRGECNFPILYAASRRSPISTPVCRRMRCGITI
jgi:hypothetical protein